MEAKYVLFATHKNGTTSYWSGAGWEPMQKRESLTDTKILTMTSDEACAVRDETKKHQINKGHTFRIVRLAVEVQS